MREIFRREIRREKVAQNALLYTTTGRIIPHEVNDMNNLFL